MSATLWTLLGLGAAALASAGIAWYYKRVAASATAGAAQAQSAANSATAAATQVQAELAATLQSLADRQAKEAKSDRAQADKVATAADAAVFLRTDGGDSGGRAKSALPSPNRIRRPFVVSGYGR